LCHLSPTQANVVTPQAANGIKIFTPVGVVYIAAFTFGYRESAFLAEYIKYLPGVQVVLLIQFGDFFGRVTDSLATGGIGAHDALPYTEYDDTYPTGSGLALPYPDRVGVVSGAELKGQCCGWPERAM